MGVQRCTTVWPAPARTPRTAPGSRKAAGLARPLPKKMYQDAKMYQDVPIPWNSMGQALENLEKLCTLRLMRYETCFRSKENLCVCVLCFGDEKKNC